jgi:NAD(P)-dependent dehydrogenase (short-subunit alcohol dehydrogenase family)
VHYSAAKAGIAGFTYATALEMADYGVTCNAFSPIIGTRYPRGNKDEQKATMVERLWPNVESGAWSKNRYNEVFNALVAPDENAGPIVAFLCSDAAAYINGCIFGIAATKLSYWPTPSQSPVFARDWETQGAWRWEEVEKNMPVLLEGWR